MYKNNRKELLFKAAFKQFVTKQFDGVSISDIEEESGLSRGAIFY
ncbi:MAG: TetR/AcrR family transcriptional regulator, partial [Bacteroidaceae bacterium]|nr:TetR/AcrR family transcriptional regulator [Bacteroidaceae bacterium]MCR5043782.1 TetR/AcrR family transcriptional regulator [Bacteroidaceae bacterium]